MKFYSPSDMYGDVLFENDRWIICHVKSSVVSSFHSKLQPKTIVNRIKDMPVHLTASVSEYFPSRILDFVCVSKNAFDYCIDAKDAHEINSVNAPPGSPICVLQSRINDNKDREFDVRKAFTCAHIKDGNLTYANSQIQPNGTVKFTQKGQEFSIITMTDVAHPPNGVCFYNEFEMIYVPFENMDKTHVCIQRIMERSEMEGRIASQYFVIPVLWEEPQACIRVRQIDYMNTKQMLKFFQHNKKSSTKMETLSVCLNSLTKHVPHLEVGDVFFIQINTNSPETPINIEPVDWTLSRSSHLRILHSHQPSKNAVNMFVEVTDQPTDDFAQALSAMMESQKRRICVVAISSSNMSTIFQEIRNRVKDATGV